MSLENVLNMPPSLPPGPVERVPLSQDGRCPHCRQQLKPLNPHRMDRRKVEILDKIARINARGHEWAKVQRDGALIAPEDLDFTIQSDDVHALRLKWFGLIQTKALRTGLYRVTQYGVGFLAGRASVPKVILCRDGEVVLRERERVWINQVKDVVLDRAYWADYWRRQFEHVQEQLF